MNLAVINSSTDEGVSRTPCSDGRLVDIRFLGSGGR